MCIRDSYQNTAEDTQPVTLTLPLPEEVVQPGLSIELPGGVWTVERIFPVEDPSAYLSAPSAGPDGSGARWWAVACSWESEDPARTMAAIPVQAESQPVEADGVSYPGVSIPLWTETVTQDGDPGKVQRGYIPRSMASGKREISDPFPAGATVDMTYSQFMPIKKDGKVVSICFVTTPLSLLSERVTRRDHTGNGYYLMLSSTGSLIAHPNPAMSLTHIRDHVAGERFLYGSSRETFLRDIKSDQPGTFISIFRNTLYFTAFMNIPETGWTLIHRVKILPTVKYMLLAKLSLIHIS